MRDHAADVRNSLTDPKQLCAGLGLLDGSKRQASGVTVCCPAHAERNPSCSVTVGPDGTIRVNCFGCGFTGDALTLIAAARGVTLRGSFREVLAIGAEIAGDLALQREILDGQEIPDRPGIAKPEPRPEVEYPPIDEVEALWEAAASPGSDPDVWEYLRSRGIDPESLDRVGVARSVPPETKTPWWARYGAATWVETGHRLLVATFDSTGMMRGVRAWRVEPGDTPKRLPPAGCRASGLVMANREAWLMLRGRYSPRRLVITEGEPDFVSAAVSWEGTAIIGIVSGSWTPDFARRVPMRTEVLIATHHDTAGDRYAMQILSTIGQRPAWRIAA
jgi:hypothetical protein